MSNKVISKIDREDFIYTLNCFLKTNGQIVERYGINVYLLTTVHGDLIVQPLETWNEHGSGCLSLTTQFNQSDSTLPVDANQYSGKWNFHLKCDKGQGKYVADHCISVLKNIMTKVKN